MSRTTWLIGLFLAAIVGANLTTGWAFDTYGPDVAIPVSLFNSFAFIGLDLTSRDALHERWDRNGLVWRMGLLVLAGSLLSYWVNNDVAPIAKASFIAFLLAAIADAICFHFLRDREWFVRVNGSNTVGAAVDSFVFPTVAFGSFIWWVVGAQFALKVLGGFVWALALSYRRRIALAR